jgi:chaperonin GroES
MRYTIEPLDDRVLVRRIPEAEGLIIAPDIAKELAGRGEVLAVGPGKMMKGGWRRPVAVNIGDIVHFSSRWNDLPMSTITDDLVLIQEMDIAVVECRN